jgi:CheY-like chemotaxis protein
MQFIIIDDEDVNLFISKKLISETLGIQDIKTFSSGADALRFLQNDFVYSTARPTVLLLDLNMPVISGWDFLDFFSQYKEELKNNVHVYILSSSIDPRDKAKALSNPNVISFITKPITKDVIRENFFLGY